MKDSDIARLMAQLQESSDSDTTTKVVTKARKSSSKRTKGSKKPNWESASLPSWFTLSKYGKQVFDELYMFINNADPVMLIGGTGLGKTAMTSAVASAIGRGSTSFNCYSGMDIASLVGLWRPNKGSIEWEHGLLTRAIIEGLVVLIEEYTRATPELKSKMFGVLDSKNRYWALPEAGIDSVPVHEGFTMVASANPAGNGYVGTMREDKASMSRFAGVIEINEPLADENKAMLNATNDKDLSDRIVRFAEILRKDPLTYISTRDMYYLATTIKSGMSAKRAVELTIAPKFEGNQETIITNARSVFEELGKEINLEESVADAIKGAN
tara:strand:- start:1948 stop:2925 length:978 start_codon:yes stop_codon:yes gene_type:complete